MNLSQYHFDHHKSNMTPLRIKPALRDVIQLQKKECEQETLWYMAVKFWKIYCGGANDFVRRKSLSILYKKTVTRDINKSHCQDNNNEEIVIMIPGFRRSVIDIFVFWDVMQLRLLFVTEILSLSVPSWRVKRSKKVWSLYFVRFYSSLNFLTIFEKNAIIEFQENPSNGSRFVPFGQTYSHDQTNSHFSQFCETAEQNALQQN